MTTAAQSVSTKPVSANPNVIFVITDDQGYGDLACHGNPVLKTPNLDKMHSESVRLDNYHVGPTCAPTRAGLMTGHYANSTGVWHTIGGRSLLRDNEVSMADIFRENGYVTGLFGKWHLGDTAPYRPQDRGFDEVVCHGGGGVGQTPDYWGNNYFDDTYWTHNIPDKNTPGKDGYTPYDGYCTDIWFNEGLRFIERHKDKPFFCYISTNAPHSPFLVDPIYSDPYVDHTPNSNRANFYGMVTNIDENFGILRAKLAEWGLTENTLLIFMTDNGSGGGIAVDANQFLVNGHNAGMRGQKGSEYDGGHRVPFFMHWPAGGVTGGHDVPTLTANVDILPTFVELCGLDATDINALDCDGTSIVPLLEQAVSGNELDWPDRAMVTDSQRLVNPIKWRKSAVMTGRWRLVNGAELYDINADPEQRTDIAADHADVVAELREAYEAWWVKVSRQFEEDIPFPLGTAAMQAGDSILITTHDWREENCECAWHQVMVREGLRCNGYWEMDVLTAGTYEFELRRWPREEDRGLAEGIPGTPVPIHELSITSGYGGGNAIPVQSATIEIAGQTASQTITQIGNDADKGAVFTLELPAGPAHLQTNFVTNDGQDVGAYYVYIKMISLIE
ncbi:MAG: arylsulfatase [Chloroflexota bacterium]